MDIISYVEQIGYWIIFIGSLVEGESIIIPAGALAAMGYLKFWWVFLIAFFGSLFADQSLFLLGRYYGPLLLKRFPRLRRRSRLAFWYLRRNENRFIMTFRFIYGIRTLSPLIIGASGVEMKKFALLNIVAAFVWALLSCGVGYAIGYFFADQLDFFIQNFTRYYKYFSAGMLIFVISLISYLYYRIYGSQNRSRKE